MNKEDREKLLEETLNKRRPYQQTYQESMDILKQTETELNKLLMENQKNIIDLSNANHISQNNVDLATLQSQIEKDFNVKIDTPQTVVAGKDSKEVFDEIEKELKETVIGQDKAVEELVIAFRRPYVTGSDPTKIRNSIILTGTNGSGRHQLIHAMGKALKEHGLTVSEEVIEIDMSRYQSSSQEALFLQDIYAALQGRNPIILLENFESASPVYNRMLAQLVLEGSCLLNKRYVFANNQLQEASAKLTKDAIDHLDGNNKVLVFVSEGKASKLLDVFGKSFIEKIDDQIRTSLLDETSLKVIVTKILQDLVQKSITQLEILLHVDNSVHDYLLQCYEPDDGIDSLTPIADKIYNELVELALRHNDIRSLDLRYDGKLIATEEDQKYELNLGSDIDQERAEIQKELDEIVGLQKVKDYLLSLENHVKVSQLRKKKGLKVAEVSKHMIFTGNPGTGKTTIARIVSRMMKASGILKQGQLVEVTRADLVGKYVGHTAPLTMDVIESALGGVLFIDEAYSLYRGKDDSFGLEAIDTLVKAMEDHRDDLIVILAGYDKEMGEFLTANTGLKSRFANIIHFEDYTGEELMLISKSIAKGKDYKIDPECEKPLQNFFTLMQARKDVTSGNGRLARNIVEDAILHQSKRVLEDPNAEFDVLKLEDFDLNSTEEMKTSK
ncbi:MAG: AAA family ATPase [Erysipelotrichaceae bacterium]|nr:AAA family ATPase [Erysipelotrichaceae bacterium]